MEKQPHEYSYFHITELTEMYLTMAVRSFALSMIGIFVPLILLQSGYSLTSVLFYQMMLPVFLFIVFATSGKLISKIGVKHTMLVSIPFFLLFYYLVYTIEVYQWPIIFISLCAALASATYWFAFHIEFAKYTKGKKRGSQIGLLNAINTAISIIGPILGGIIISVSGPKALILINSALMICSGVPLLLTKDEKVTVHITPKEVFFTTTFRQRISFICEGLRSYSATIFWPLFLFFMQISFFIIGSVYTVVRIVNTLTSVVVGKYLDKHHPKKVLKLGTTLNAISLFIRAFLPITAVAATSITSLGGLGFTIMNNSYAKIWYEKAHHFGARFILSRELYLEIGRFFIVGIALVLFLVLSALGYELLLAVTIMCITIFIIGAIATLVMNIID